MASIMDRLKRLSGYGGSSAEDNSGISSPRTNVWSSVFDPGSNRNLSKAGRSYYDTPSEGKTTWDQVCTSEDSKRNSEDLGKVVFTTMASSKGGIDAEDLKKMLAPDRVESIMKMADKNGDGKIDFDEFMDMVRRSA